MIGSCTSYSCMMLGCRSILSMQISRVTRYISACSTIFYFCSVLIATFCAVWICTPILTLPKVPSPMLSPWLIKRYRRGIVLLGSLWSRTCSFPTNLRFIIRNGKDATSTIGITNIIDPLSSLPLSPRRSTMISRRRNLIHLLAILWNVCCR